MFLKLDFGQISTQLKINRPSAIFQYIDRGKASSYKQFIDVYVGTLFVPL